ncbi:hypothetical protein [uncultured Megasphaera sp.]|uniref:hypothetical protein n=1 Tax=uncultured Megasphaera sp. TaxID=165188 RepID=UPI00267057A3|nr:hypothetical protein [uncultured Megasphaera sp.]
MKKLEKIFMPYLDFSEISCPFKPGTPDKVKKAKEEWDKKMNSMIKKHEELASFTG